VVQRNSAVNEYEGTGGPGIVSSNMDSLTIANNYFESNNCDGGGNDECTVKVNVGQVPGPLVLKPTLFRCVSCSHL
jgi:hypothetical protein